jgi:hypothetical protein
MSRYLVLFLFIAVTANADLHVVRPAVPPRADDVVGFANAPSFDFRIPRDRFIAFLRSAHAYTSLPADLQKRGESGELEFIEAVPDGKGGKDKITPIWDLHGVFTDKKGIVYFWQAVGPRFLIVATEDGAGCYYYLEEKETKDLELRPTR